MNTVAKTWPSRDLSVNGECPVLHAGSIIESGITMLNIKIERV